MVACSCPGLPVLHPATIGLAGFDPSLDHNSAEAAATHAGLSRMDEVQSNLDLSTNPTRANFCLQTRHSPLSVRLESGLSHTLLPGCASPVAFTSDPFRIYARLEYDRYPNVPFHGSWEGKGPPAVEDNILRQVEKAYLGLGDWWCR